VAAHFEVSTLPATVLFKGQGSMEQLARCEGRMSKQDLELWLRQHLHLY